MRETKKNICTLSHLSSQSVIFKYLSFVFRLSIIHLPAIFRKDLPIVKGEDLLWRAMEKCISWCSVLSYTDRVCGWGLLTSPLETGKANFISTSKMDFLSVSSICLCANRRLRISWRRTEQHVKVGPLGPRAACTYAKLCCGQTTTCK